MNPGGKAPLFSGPMYVTDVSPPPSPPRLSGRLSSTSTSYTVGSEAEPLPLEEIAALMTRGGGGAAKEPAAKEAKPKLTVSASGRFQDQFYHTQEASRTVGLFKNRALVKQSNDGTRSDAAVVKRRKSLNVNGRDVEQFSDADIIFSGYLVKQGSFWKTWRRRYFILRRDINILAYYTSQENLVKLGEIVVDGETKVTPPSAKETAFPGKFTVEHNNRKLVLVAEDGRESAETWAMLINRCVATRAAEAEAAAMSKSSRGSSERESMRSSLMQLRLSANGSQLVSDRGGRPSGLGLESLDEDTPTGKNKQPAVKSNPPTKTSPTTASAGGKPSVTALEAVEIATMPAVQPADSAAAAKIKRHSTDSRVIQAAADEAAHKRESDFMDDEERERIVRSGRLKSIDSANDSARKLLAASKSTGSGSLSVPKPRRLFRSYSAGSVLSTRSSAYAEARKLHDDCGLLAPRMPGNGDHPNSNKNLRNSLAAATGSGDLSSSSATRARNLSLPSFRPAPSIELSVSIGCRGAQDISHMVVVLSAIMLESRGETKELGRTEVQGALSLRACGGDFYARDFSALLPVPISGGRNLMLQFDIYSVVNLGSDSLANQQSLGFVRIPHVDLLFSGESTLVLECLRSKLSPSKQTYFLVLDRIRPNESLNLGHSYTYAKRHFIADIVPFDLRVETSADMFAPSPLANEKPTSGNRSSFEVIAPPAAPPPATAPLNRKGQPSSRAYGGMVRGDSNSSDASQVFISEELSASYCSISVAAKYMNLVQQRNQRRMHDAKLLINDIERKYEQIPSSPNSRTESSDIINLHIEMIRDAENRVDHYRKLYDSYDECEDYYEKLLAMLENGLEPGITGCLKRSTQKKDKRTEFMPTNLNCHVVRARRVALSAPQTTFKDQGTREKPVGASGDELVYAVVTHGCPAAHCLGFKDGGLRRLQQTLVQSKDKDNAQLLERIEQRQDIVRCQVLSIASASFLTVIGLAANQSARHQERLQLMCQTGFLINMESLLSTIKNEKGMIEDMYEGVQWLNSTVSLQVVQSLEVNPKLKCAKCVGITSSENGSNVVATFALPSDVFEALPDVLRQGQALKVHALMFTQGINEMQSVANHVLDTSLQDEINLESSTRLVRYFQVYKTHVLAMQPPNPARIKDLPDLEVEIKILAEKLNQSRKSSVQKKNVNILIESSDLCRRLGAGRTTCCKSGKDRTGMSVTLECSRLLVDKFHVKQGVHLCNAMRERGVRRVNVLANTGKDKFAFNSFQLKYLPDCYRPPALSADSKVQS